MRPAGRRWSSVLLQEALCRSMTIARRTAPARASAPRSSSARCANGRSVLRGQHEEAAVRRHVVICDGAAEAQVVVVSEERLSLSHQGLAGSAIEARPSMAGLGRQGHAAALELGGTGVATPRTWTVFSSKRVASTAPSRSEQQMPAGRPDRRRCPLHNHASCAPVDGDGFDALGSWLRAEAREENGAAVW
jgi:hypothetical protein